MSHLIADFFTPTLILLLLPFSCFSSLSSINFLLSDSPPLPIFASTAPHVLLGHFILVIHPFSLPLPPAVVHLSPLLYTLHLLLPSLLVALSPLQPPFSLVFPHFLSPLSPHPHPLLLPPSMWLPLREVERSGADRNGPLVSGNDTQAEGPLRSPLLGMMGFSHHGQR